MKRNGMYMLDFRVPALVGRQLTYLDARRYLGQLVAICFLPHAGLIASEDIDHQAGQFQAIETALLIVTSEVHPFHRLWSHHSEKPWTPVLADSSGRLHRWFGVVTTEPSPVCHTFVVNGEGTLRLATTHDLADSDLDVLRKIVMRSRLQGAAGVIDEEKETDERRTCLQA